MSSACTNRPNVDSASDEGVGALERPRPRLLLLEFVTHERWVFDSRFFPFIKGCAETLGIAARWLCFGCTMQTVKTGRTTMDRYMDLDAEEMATLEQQIASLRPTHVIVSHPISDGVVKCLQRNQAKLLSVSDLAGDGVANFEDLSRELVGDRGTCPPCGTVPRYSPSNPSWQQGRTDWLLRWLDVDPGETDLDGRYLVGAVSPRYDALMANQRACMFEPHLTIMGGVACDHFQKVGENPHYEGVDLSDIVQDYGCGYCTWYRGPTSELNVDPVQSAEQQIRRAMETSGPEGRFRGIFDMHDIRLFRQLDRLFDRVLALSLPPTTFCFEPRLDRALEAAASLRSVLPRLTSAGHRICLFRMGAENLVEEENELFNKHTTLAQIDGGMQELADLAVAYPSAFEHDPSYGYITCSPWTSFEMLETGVNRALARQFDPMGVWLYTPLLLFRDAPITRLARRDGLVVSEFDDIAVLYEPSVNQVAFDCFLPWRFKDIRTGIAFSLIVRFCAAALREKYPDTIFHGDETYEYLLSRGAADLTFHRPDIFAREVIAEVRACSPPEPRAVLRSALARYVALNPAPVVSLDRPADRLLHHRLMSLCQSLGERFKDRLAGVTTTDCRISAPDSSIRLHLAVDGVEYTLHLRDRHKAKEYFFRTDHWNVVFDNRTPPSDREQTKKAAMLVKLLDRAATQHAPELLPSASPGGRGLR